MSPGLGAGLVMLLGAAVLLVRWRRSRIGLSTARLRWLAGLLAMGLALDVFWLVAHFQYGLGGLWNSPDPWYLIRDSAAGLALGHLVLAGLCLVVLGCRWPFPYRYPALAVIAVWGLLGAVAGRLEWAAAQSYLANPSEPSAPPGPFAINPPHDSPWFGLALALLLMTAGWWAVVRVDVRQPAVLVSLLCLGLLVDFVWVVPHFWDPTSGGLTGFIQHGRLIRAMAITLMVLHIVAAALATLIMLPWRGWKPTSVLRPRTVR